MAVGDAVVNLTSVANGAYLPAQPGAGVEWFIHQWYHEDAVEFYWYDGTNNLLSGSATGADHPPWGGRATNSIYPRIKNVSGTTKLLGFSGVVTK